MTWRERIQAARERGEFTSEDRDLAWNPLSCAVAEALAGVGLGVGPDWENYFAVSADDLIDESFPIAVRRNNFTEAERLLGIGEDRALQLKRERLAPSPQSGQPITWDEDRRISEDAP